MHYDAPKYDTKYTELWLLEKNDKSKTHKHIQEDQLGIQWTVLSVHTNHCLSISSLISHLLSMMQGLLSKLLIRLGCFSGYVEGYMGVQESFATCAKSHFRRSLRHGECRVL